MLITVGVRIKFVLSSKVLFYIKVGLSSSIFGTITYVV